MHAGIWPHRSKAIVLLLGVLVWILGGGYLVLYKRPVYATGQGLESTELVTAKEFESKAFQVANLSVLQSAVVRNGKKLWCVGAFSCQVKRSARAFWKTLQYRAG